MKEKLKMAYEVPQLTVVSFRIEQGFVASCSSSLSGMFGLGRSWSNDDGDAWSGDNSGGGGNRRSGLPTGARFAFLSTCCGCGFHVWLFDWRWGNRIGIETLLEGEVAIFRYNEITTSK